MQARANESPAGEAADDRSMPELKADFFDGRTSRAYPVRLQIVGDQLHISGSGIARGVSLAEVRWPSRMRGRAADSRVAHLRDGGSLHCADAPAWDRWTVRNGVQPSLVTRAQQSWSWTLGACIVLLGLLALTYVWGLPLAARGLLAVTPPALDRAIGQAMLEASLDRLLGPSELSGAQQAHVRGRFDTALQAAYGAGRAPDHQLLFRAGRAELGPNALAVPGGTIVLTDAMVRLADGDDAMLVGVLAHEMGHVRHRHGMQMLARGAAVALALTVAMGDVSNLVALAPVVLGQAAYSREFEREADQEAVHVLRHTGLSPLVMVTMFERMDQWRKARRSSAAAPVGAAGASAPASAPVAGAPPGAEPAPELPGLSSHPTDAERIRFFRAAAAQ